MAIANVSYMLNWFIVEWFQSYHVYNKYWNLKDFNEFILSNTFMLLVVPIVSGIY
jgi:hypothetical protein